MVCLIKYKIWEPGTTESEVRSIPLVLNFWRIHPATSSSTNVLSFDRSQVRCKPVRLASGKRHSISTACAQSEGPGAHGASARNVGGSIAHDQNFIPLEWSAEQFGTAKQSNPGQLISVFVVVAESAKSERFPDSEVPELDFGAKPNIARQEADDGLMFQCSEGAKERRDACTQAAGRVPEVLVQQKHVAGKKPIEIRALGWNLVSCEKLAHQ